MPSYQKMFAEGVSKGLGFLEVITSLAPTIGTLINTGMTTWQQVEAIDRAKKELSLKRAEMASQIADATALRNAVAAQAAEQKEPIPVAQSIPEDDLIPGVPNIALFVGGTVVTGGILYAILKSKR